MGSNKGVVVNYITQPPHGLASLGSSRVPILVQIVIASEAWQSRRGNGQRSGNEIATSLRSSR